MKLQKTNTDKKPDLNDSLISDDLRNEITEKLMKNEEFREAMKIAIEATTKMCMQAAEAIGEILTERK